MAMMNEVPPNYFMELWSQSMEQGARLSSRHCFYRLDQAGKIVLSDNISPHLAWSGAPKNTESYAVLAFDECAPTITLDVNQAHTTLPPELPRTDFFHWVLAIPAQGQAGALPEGAFGQGVIPQGKPQSSFPSPAMTGLNDYTGRFQSDSPMAGGYFGYDGPGPPQNDELVHRYHFVVYALGQSTARLGLPDNFTGWDLRAAIEGHILDEGRLTVLYSLE